MANGEVLEVLLRHPIRDELGSLETSKGLATHEYCDYQFTPKTELSKYSTLCSPASGSSSWESSLTLDIFWAGLLSSSISSVLRSWERLCCFGWIVTALDRTMAWVEHWQSYCWVSPKFFCSGLKVYHLPPASSVREDTYSTKAWLRQSKMSFHQALDLILELDERRSDVFGQLSKIMAASTIAISSDSSDESVGSPPSRVIPFGDIPTVIPSTSVVAPETSTIAPVISSVALVVKTTLVASPTGLCGLIPYSDSDFDSPDEMSSSEHISPLPAISPFLCTDSSEAPDSSDGPPSQDPYVATIARWRSRVTTRPSSSSEFPIAPITAPPGIRRRLTLRHASPCSRDHHSSSSSSSLDSSAVHSLGLDAPDQAHSGSSTRDVSPRLCYPSRRAPRSITGSLAPTRTDLSPPCKIFRDSYSSEASIEEDVEVSLTGTEVDMELGIGNGDEVGDHVGIDHRDARDDTKEYKADASVEDMAEVGIDPMTAPLVEEEIVEPAGEDSPDSAGTRDGIVRSVEDMPVNLGKAMHNFYHHMSEVCVDRIVGNETAQRRLEADQLIASRDRARMAKMIYSLRLENLKVRAMLDIERDRVSSLRLHMSLLQEEFRQIRRDRDDARGRLRRLESYLGRHFGFRP
ncbi:hypothetical protein Tco_0784271 [Tanacetum coccineum]